MQPVTKDAASGTATNRLAEESSPYLRQHAHNPVHWWPWGLEALEHSRSSGKPILLSIGYAACHWCHVMAHESFEDERTAALMNQHFVNIKVDREERPDLDRIYQLAHQLLIGRGGGWPLTLFLHHADQRPFFGGTYFPPAARFGLPAFADLLLKVASYYRENQDSLREPGEALVRALQDLNPSAAHSGALSEQPLRDCRAQLERRFDRDWGGFGAAPKFPHAEFLTRLMRDWERSARQSAPDLQALYMASLTLTRMAEGGLFDQLGGGFCRYSVDERWEIPHFEKMLYDNALLLPVYAEAAAATGDSLYADTARRTGEWLLREMRAPEGGFYSSLDADSEGHEGKYYVWDRTDVRAALPAEEYAQFERHYGLDQPANFEGRWHLKIARRLNGPGAEPAATAGAQPSTLPETLLSSARARLCALRERRVRPGLDDKRLTAWNALAIRGLAVAARALGREDFTAAATAALDFLRSHHWRAGRLLASSNRGPARLQAYLDDYAFLADAILELQTLRFRAEELQFAIALCDCMLAHFSDPQGGFFFTADDHEPLIVRSKVLGDDATPAGNGVAARVLQRLGWLLAEPRYLTAAEQVLRSAWPAMQRYPEGHVSLLLALEEHLRPPDIVILRGPAAIIESWRAPLAAGYSPRRLVLSIAEELDGLPAALAAKPAFASGAAYLCRGMQCSAALHSPAALDEALRAQAD